MSDHKLPFTETKTSFSFWTGGTRKLCRGQYSWCFSNAEDSLSTLDKEALHSQMLSGFSGNGACVLGTRARDLSGNFDQSFINEDCTVKAQLACVAVSGAFKIDNTKVR
jgi:hypothetical protein